ncbi:MAG: BadF/BadG/BcrA/BcrD ATPase family protein [Candidatus Latescibacteria bacterium]|nr:BadF/BadG/BcrA/BcrD ATPase family protein [Candidatus Latescibacterota bacterium]
MSTHPAVLCAGVAGAGRLAEQVALKGELESRVLAESILVVTDARTALEGAHCGSPGIVCIAGTGSMVLGRNASGEEARAGGWDPVLGDEGSAYWLVLESVRRALRALDGSGPTTQLRKDLLEVLDLSEWDEIIAGVYGGGLSRERIAEACPAVFAAARSGDQVAVEVIDSGARPGCPGGCRRGASLYAGARRSRLHGRSVRRTRRSPSSTDGRSGAYCPGPEGATGLGSPRGAAAGNARGRDPRPRCSSRRLVSV